MKKYAYISLALAAFLFLLSITITFVGSLPLLVRLASTIVASNFLLVGILTWYTGTKMFFTALHALSCAGAVTVTNIFLLAVLQPSSALSFFISIGAISMPIVTIMLLPFMYYVRTCLYLTSAARNMDYVLKSKNGEESFGILMTGLFADTQYISISKDNKKVTYIYNTQAMRRYMTLCGLMYRGCMKSSFLLLTRTLSFGRLDRIFLLNIIMCNNMLVEQTTVAMENEKFYHSEAEKCFPGNLTLLRWSLKAREEKIEERVKGVLENGYSIIASVAR